MDASTIQNCRLVSKSWYDLIETDQELWFLLGVTPYLNAVNTHLKVLQTIEDIRLLVKQFKNRDKLFLNVPDLKTDPSKVRESIAIAHVLTSYYQTELRCYQYLKKPTTNYHPIVTALKKGYLNKSLYQNLLHGLTAKETQSVIKDSITLALEFAKVDVLKVLLELAQENELNFKSDWQCQSLLQYCYNLRSDVQIIELVMSFSTLFTTKMFIRQVFTDSRKVLVQPFELAVRDGNFDSFLRMCEVINDQSVGIEKACSSMYKRKRHHDMITLLQMAMKRFERKEAKDIWSMTTRLAIKADDLKLVQKFVQIANEYSIEIDSLEEFERFRKACHDQSKEMIAYITSLCSKKIILSNKF